MGCNGPVVRYLEGGGSASASKWLLLTLNIPNSEFLLFLHLKQVLQYITNGILQNKSRCNSSIL